MGIDGSPQILTSSGLWYLGCICETLFRGCLTKTKLYILQTFLYTRQGRSHSPPRSIRPNWALLFPPFSCYQLANILRRCLSLRWLDGAAHRQATGSLLVLHWRVQVPATSGQPIICTGQRRFSVERVDMQIGQKHRKEYPTTSPPVWR